MGENYTWGHEKVIKMAPESQVNRVFMSQQLLEFACINLPVGMLINKLTKACINEGGELSYLVLVGPPLSALPNIAGIFCPRKASRPNELFFRLDRSYSPQNVLCLDSVSVAEKATGERRRPSTSWR